MKTISQLLNSISQAQALTMDAITAVKNDDWESAQSLTDQRDALLQLPASYDDYDSSQQLSIRQQLETLDRFNTDFLNLVEINRKYVMQEKSILTKGQQAINRYLDNV